MLVKTMSEEELRVRKNARKNSRLPCPHCRVKDSRVLETYTGAGRADGASEEKVPCVRYQVHNLGVDAEEVE